MDRKIFAILAIFLFILGGVFSASMTIMDNANGYVKSTNITINFTDLNDNIFCLGQIFDSNSGCTPVNITSNDFNTNYTLSGADGPKNVYAYPIGSSTAAYSDSTNLKTEAPTYTTTIYDGNAFNSAPTLTIIFTGASSESVLLNGVATTYSGTILSGLTNASHTLTIDANDLAGNNTNATITFTYDTNAPSSISISSAFTSNYTNDTTPTFTISATDSGSGMTGGKAYFSCSQTGTWKEITYTTSYAEFDITSTKYDCNTADGTKTIYAKFKDKAGNESAITSTTVKYDGTVPSAPTGVSVEGGNNEVTVSWTAPTADNLSGNKEYKVYKNGELYATTSSTSKTVTGLTNGTSYSFKVTTIDNAGNESAFSSTVEGTPQSCSCALVVERSGISVTYVKSNDNLVVSCNWDEDVDDARIKYRYYNGSWGSTQNLSDEEDDISYLEENFSVSGSNERIEFQCVASGIDTTTKTIYIDNEAPEITWGTFSTTITGTQEVSVTVSDNRSIGNVEFEFNGVKRGTTKSGSTYSWNLNSTEVNNGNYTLKAIAKDEAGNERVVTKTITVDNELDEEQEVQQAIDNAKKAKQETEDLIKYFNEKGLEFDENLLNDKATADSLISEAESATDNIIKKDKANQAKALYEQINNSAAIEDTEKEATYEFDVNKLTEKLYALGLSQGQVEKASALILSGNVTRKLSIIKIGDEYKAQIEISLSLDGNDETYKIVEVIPKEFVNSASQIFSGMDFSILEDDPVIEFIVPKDTDKIYYSISVDEETANKLIDNNVIALFSAPPIIMSSEDTLTITKGVDMTLLAIIGVIIVIILVGIIVIAYIGRPKSGFEQKTQSGLSSKIKDKVKIGNKDSKGKWKYKG